MKPNKSKTYLAPLILSKLDNFEFSRVVNTFTSLDVESKENLFYILYKTDDLDDTTIKTLYSQAYSVYKVEDKHLFAIEVPLDLIFEFLCFNNGMYSKYRAENKKNIVKYLYSNVSRAAYGVLETVEHVFKRSPNYKTFLESTLDVKLEEDTELASIPNSEDEKFKSIEHEQFRKIKEAYCTIES